MIQPRNLNELLNIDKDKMDKFVQSYFDKDLETVENLYRDGMFNNLPGYVKEFSKKFYFLGFAAAMMVVEELVNKDC